MTMYTFAQRVANASAWNSVHFNNLSYLSQRYNPQLAAPQWWGYVVGNGDVDGNGQYFTRVPTIDATEGVESAGALRFIHRFAEGSGSQGNWVTTLNGVDNSRKLALPGEYAGTLVQEIWVQVQIKWNNEMATYPFQTVNGDIPGCKLFDISQLDPAGGAYSSSNSKQVIQTHNRPFSARHIKSYIIGALGGTDELDSDHDFNLQNAQGAGACAYPGYSGCIDMVGGEWTTHTLRHKILGRTPGVPQCVEWECDVYFQRDGQARQHIIAWNNTVVGYAPKVMWDDTIAGPASVGTIWLFPYMTSYAGYPTNQNGDMIAWYDNLIVGPNDPGEAIAATFGSSGGGSSPGSSPTPSTPQRRPVSRVRVIG